MAGHAQQAVGPADAADQGLPAFAAEKSEESETREKRESADVYEGK